MNGESIMQISMETSVKEQVEELYRKMGMNFSEAVRIFAAQSLLVRGMPFQPTTVRPFLPRDTSVSGLAGSLRKYATPELLAKEEEVLSNAFERATLEKYGEKYGVAVNDAD